MESGTHINNDTLSAERLKIDNITKKAWDIRNSEPREALAEGEHALELSEKISYLKGKADSLSVIGFANNHLANHEKALTCLLESLAIYEQLNDEAGIGSAQYNLGTLYLRIGAFDLSIESLHKSLSIREKLNDRAGIASCCFQLCYIHQHFKDLDAAKESALRSLEIRRELNDNLGIAASLMVMGDFYIKTKDFDKAKEVLYESLERRKSGGEQMGYFASLLRCAELHIELKEFDEAREKVMLGMQISIDEDVKFGIMRFKQILGKLELRMGNIKAAKEKFLDSLKYAEEFGFKSVQYEIMASVADIYKQEGDYKKAFEYFEKHHQLKEEVISMQTSNQLKSVQFMNQIEFSKKEAELEKTKNTELQKAYSIIEDKNKEIIDSIRYAKRIQQALLANERYIDKVLNYLKK